MKSPPTDELDGPNQGATGDVPPSSESTEPAGGQSPLSAPTSGNALSEHPEILVGAAFAGGFVAAQILKRLGGG